ncbi:hemoglobin/transferrin/lactoferrin receptor protein [Fodinibius salinus]|uniref:Hemoglobin/transferrin/lactoferrin receptor protein n=1 Tax=Fodinibius salinus TaxID=860790 RepID=A0A5D3YF31_9BACT|nr:TonB-dependent receptor [Fodinibius salinus]TYP92016.1 hemoglobin/transferrin/lactoferrin receptor protein [Fodinibius salinus]
MKKYLLTMLLTVLYVSGAFAQSITVVDKETGDPLEGVNIFTKDRSIAEVTNSQGNASIEDFAEAETIIFSYVGYNTVRFSYNEIANRTSPIALQQKPLSMGDMVVSANRWKQDTREVPVSVAQITPEEAQLQNPQTAADLLGVSNEVFIQKSQMGGGSPMIRGFATNRVLLVIDGVRMNNAIFRGGNLQNVISLDANAIENTEVVLGPGSVTYGSDAIGGVMSFNTLTPKLSVSSEPRIEGNTLTRISSANWGKTGHIDLNLGFKNWGSVTSLTYSDYQDMRMGTDGPSDYRRSQYVERINGQDQVLTNERPNIQHPTGYNQVNVMQKFRYRPSESWDLKLGMHYSTTTNLPRYDRLTEKQNGQFRKAEWYYGPQQWFMTNFNATYYSDAALFDKLKTTVAYQDYEESRNDRDFQDPNLRNREEHVRSYSANVDFEKQLTNRSTLFYGLEGVINKVYSNAHVTDITTNQQTPTSTRYPDDSRWQSYAAFVNYKNNLSEKFTLTAGARYNQYLIDATIDAPQFQYNFGRADINRSAVTGSAGFVYRPTESWKIDGHISTGFRAPNIDDIGKIFDSEPGSVIVPNSNLDPEYAYNFELGLQKMFGDRLKLDLSAFYTILDNALARRDFTVNGQDSVVYDGTLSQVQAIQNVASAKVWGAQASMELQISPSLNLSSDISLQKGEEDGPNGTTVPVRHVAPTFGSTHLTYEPGNLTIDAYADYNGEIPFSDLAPSEKGKPHLYALNSNGNPYSPSWYTLNLKSSYNISDNISLNFGVENITNQRYRPYSSGIAAPGRNIIFGIRGHI